MHKFMSELHQDHINLSRLLTIMEGQSKQLDSEDTDPDFLLLLDIAHYIRNYPDLVHHPKENIIYEAFAKRSSQARSVLDELLSQHESMPEATEDFHELIENVAHGEQIIDKETLKTRLNDFIALQKAHMDIEEEQLFPLINQTLNDEDWTTLEKSISDAKDPLFGDKILDHYQKLFQCIELQC